jgi:hypothetical protein
VRPDLIALAKGMTGGYLPMAATLVSQPIFDAFLGDYAEFKAFFHGHSYTCEPTRRRHVPRQPRRVAITRISSTAHCLAERR